MHGNVWELCLDGLVANLGTDAVTDPLSTASGSKVIRGSAWDETLNNLRSAARLSVGAGNTYRNMGFRVKAAVPGH
jgi:formylglycine-generating enzyme required for sulfatase activity